MLISLDNILKQEIKDEVIIFPTDTVYGLAASIKSEVACKKIYDLKQRAYDKPLAILCSSIEQVKTLVDCDDDTLSKCNVLWPGAITFVFKKKGLNNGYITNTDKIGIRIPNSKIALDILEKFGPMATTSVNYSGEPSCIKLDSVIDFKADYIVTDHENSKDIASTVYDVLNNKVLRLGIISEELINKTFNEK